mgnify:FL=1
MRNKNKKGYNKINSSYSPESVIKAEGIINGKVVTEHKRWPVGRKRKLLLKIDDSNIQPIANGSDITPVVAYLTDVDGGIKRLSDEYIKFFISGEGTLIEKENIGINPQKVLWGESVALVRSSLNSGVVSVRAELLSEGINTPDPAYLEFVTEKSSKQFIFDEIPKTIKKGNISPKNINDANQLNLLKNKIDSLKKKLQDFKINEVGKQQQDFIQ